MIINRDTITELWAGKKRKDEWFCRWQIREYFEGSLEDGTTIGAILFGMYKQGKLKRKRDSHPDENRFQKVWYYQLKKSPGSARS